MSLIYVLFLAGLGFLLERLSSRKPFDRLHHQLTTSKNVLECDEAFALTTTITNGKPRPVLFLHLEENVPDGLVLLDKDSPEMKVVLDHFNKRKASLHQTLYLMPRQKVTRTVRCSLSHRGRYVLHDGKMEVGDLLGLEANTMQLAYFRELVVLPRRVESPSIEAAFGSYLGDISVRRFILMDPILTAGFREYTGREPMRDISWPISLRQSKLMVKQYDYTSELTASVLLNIAGGSEEEKELCYSYARCACEFLEGKRVSYSFLTNAYVTNSTGRWSFMGEGLGDSHLAAILEGLGRGSYEYVGGLKKLLNNLLRQADRSRAFILVTVPLDESDYAYLKNFENRTGISFFVITADVESKEAIA